MSHIVESCPLTKLNDGLSRLHPADEDAVSWLTNYGSWHAYEKKKKNVTNWPQWSWDGLMDPTGSLDLRRIWYNNHSGLCWPVKVTAVLVELNNDKQTLMWCSVADSNDVPYHWLQQLTMLNVGLSDDAVTWLPIASGTWCNEDLHQFSLSWMSWLLSFSSDWCPETLYITWGSATGEVWKTPGEFHNPSIVVTLYCLHKTWYSFSRMQFN